MSIKQSYPDSFAEPKSYPSQKPATNFRYKDTFKQNYFTAGDEEQFACSLVKRLPKRRTDNICQEIDFSDKFKGNTGASLMDTFRYLFYKFKKGIFIQIRDGKVALFLPFSNAHFVNEWHSLVTRPLPDELEESDSVLPIHQWYANNYLVRYESPANEGDTGCVAIKNMFDELCGEKDVPDVDFFVNRRDFPLLKADGTEPYEAIYGAGRVLVSHSYSSYLPILSMVESDNFADIALPTPDDWSRVCSLDNPPRYFMATKRTLVPFKDNSELSWEKKINKAIFRGSATGEGIGPNNARIQLCSVADSRIDAQIVGGSTRYQIVNGKLVKQDSNRGRAFLSGKEQSMYKYIINISGHVRAHRLSAEFSYGSVILLVGNRYRLWFEKSIREWEHYVPVKEDLSDLIDKINWCESNDDECKNIAQRARDFYDKFLTKKAILNYLERLTWKMSEHTICGLGASESPSIPKALSINMPVLNQTRCLFKIISAAHNSVSTRQKPHHFLIGKTCVNSILKQIPGFLYTYANNNVERLESGITMANYIRGKEFVFNDWLGMMKLLALSLHVAQETSSLIFHNLFPKNIFIYEEQTQVSFDYLLGNGRIIRVFSQRIPIILDYSQGYAANNGIILQKYGGFETFKDCITILMSSAGEIARFQCLSRAEQSTLLHLFNALFVGEDTFYTKKETFRDLERFLQNNETFLSFYPKGRIACKSPLQVYENIQVKTAGWLFEEVPFVEKSHMGKIMNFTRLPPSQPNPIFQRFLLQQLWKIVVNKNRFPDCADEIDFSRFFMPTTKYVRENVHNENLLLYPEIRQLVKQMIADGGKYALSEREKAEARRLIITLFK